MSTEIIYEITIENVHIDVIANKLKKLDLNVYQQEIEDVGKKALDPNHIMCSEIFLDNEPRIEITNVRKQTLKKINGIEKVEILHEKILKEKEKTSWLPIITSTAGTALTLLGVLAGLGREFNLKLDLMAYGVYLGIPSAATFLSGLGGLKLETLRRRR